MSKTRTTFIIGVIIAILPYLGIPHNWKTFLFSLLGSVLALGAYIVRRNTKRKKALKETFDNFSENTNFVEEENPTIIVEEFSSN